MLLKITILSVEVVQSLGLKNEVAGKPKRKRRSLNEKRRKRIPKNIEILIRSSLRKLLHPHLFCQLLFSIQMQNLIRIAGYQKANINEQNIGANGDKGQKDMIETIMMITFTIILLHTHLLGIGIEDLYQEYVHVMVIEWNQAQVRTITALPTAKVGKRNETTLGISCIYIQ